MHLYPVKKFRQCAGPLSAVLALAVLPAVSAQAAELAYVNVVAPSPEEAVSWYGRYLDCEADAGRGNVVNCGGVDIVFEPGVVLGGSQGTGLDHISLSYPDVAAKMAQLEAVGVGGLGVRLQRFADGASYRDIPGFFTTAFIYDPWGTSIELVEDPAAAGFHHVHLSAADPAATIAWYAERLGAEPASLNGHEGLRLDNAWVLVSRHEGVPPAPTEGRVLDHLGLALTDFDARVNRLIEAGVAFEQEASVPATGRSDAARALVAGPDEVLLALVEPHWAGTVPEALISGQFSERDDSYAAPQTPWGEPELQGIWTGDAAHGIPLERPEDVSAQESVSLAEAAARRERGTLRSIWGYEREWRDTTLGYARNAPITQVAMIIDPPDGRLPPLTPEARARQAAQSNSGPSVPAGPEDLNSYVRCITQGLPNLMLPTIYNNGLQIVQSPGVVAIQKEMIHETRVIPIDAPPIGEDIAQWLGDSRGWWEGDSLVVETRNFNGRVSFRGSTENMVLTERFTRVAPDLLQYEFTVDDPAVWTRPWTATFPFVLDDSQYELVEYACHEGNYAMSNILSAARDGEATAD